MAHCGLHLPGNIPCPNPPVYRVSGKINEPKAYETNPPSFREVTRFVCISHLEAGIHGALEHAPNTHFVATVALLDPRAVL